MLYNQKFQSSSYIVFFFSFCHKLCNSVAHDIVFLTVLDYVTDYCDAFCEAEICVVSFNRFSNYCVKQAGQLDNLHLVVG